MLFESINCFDRRDMKFFTDKATEGGAEKKIA